MFEPTQEQRDEARRRMQADMGAPVSTGLLSGVGGRKPTLRFAEIPFMLVFAEITGVCSVGNFSNAEHLLGSVNLTLSVLSIFMAGRKSAR